MYVKEVADYLGVTKRTVERYVETGRLPSRIVEQPDGRRRTVIEEDDAAALKAAIEQARTERARRPVSPTAMQHISFRVEPDYLQLLAEEAVRRRLKPTECARQLFAEALTARADNAARLDALQQTVSGVEDELHDLRRDVAQAVYQILVETGGMERDEARSLVLRLFNRERAGT